jgi:hypothetical protein
VLESQGDIGSLDSLVKHLAKWQLDEKPTPLGPLEKEPAGAEPYSKHSKYGIRLLSPNPPHPESEQLEEQV